MIAAASLNILTTSCNCSRTPDKSNYLHVLGENIGCCGTMQTFSLTENIKKKNTWHLPMIRCITDSYSMPNLGGLQLQEGVRM